MEGPCPFDGKKCDKCEGAGFDDCSKIKAIYRPPTSVVVNKKWKENQMEGES